MENPPSNTSTPDRPSFHWVEEPKRRGTFGILSLCFSTLIICIWSTLHLDIPIMRHSRTRRCFLQIGWMVFALLAPEVLLYSAILERIDASALAKAAEEHSQYRHVAEPGMFTRAYNFIFRRARVKSEDQERYTSKERTSRLREHRFGIVHAFYSGMGGFKFDINSNDGTAGPPAGLSRKTADTFQIPLSETVVFLMKHFPDIIPDIPEESITDRAESSALNKALLIVQVGWFCMNCASRLVEHLPLSLLEVSTAAHGFCSLLTFFIWWSKPFNIAESTIIKGREAREVYELLTCSGREYDRALEMAKSMAARDFPLATNTNEEKRIATAAPALQHLPNAEGRPLNPFTNNWVSAPRHVCESRQDSLYESIIMTASTMLYGGIHLLARSSYFPTPQEHMLWRVSSVVVMCSGLALVLLERIIKYFDRLGPTWGAMIFHLLQKLVMPLAYMLASGFLVVECFRQLFFLESTAYLLPSWSNYWPHFS